MPWLLLVSLVWAQSFGLIKGQLAGLDPSLVAFLRLTLALAVFLPFARPREIGIRELVTLGAIGAVQFGVMYAAYIASFAALEAYEVAVLTVFTPLFVCLIDDAWEKRVSAWPLLAAAVATGGAAVVLMDRPLTSASWRGIALVQVSNLCFAAGQVAYRRWKRQRPQVSEAGVFFALYLGAVMVVAIPALPAFSALPAITPAQWLTLLYLGVVASGLGFFAWNHGAARTSTGELAVANNIKIPLAVATAIAFFHARPESLARLVIGTALIVLAGAIAHWKRRPAPPAP